MPIYDCQLYDPTHLQNGNISRTIFYTASEKIQPHTQCKSPSATNTAENISYIILFRLCSQNTSDKEQKLEYFLQPVHIDINTWTNIYNILNSSLESKFDKNDLISQLAPYLDDDPTSTTPSFDKHSYKIERTKQSSHTYTLTNKKQDKLNLLLTCFLSERVFTACEARDLQASLPHKESCNNYNINQLFSQDLCLQKLKIILDTFMQPVSTAPSPTSSIQTTSTNSTDSTTDYHLPKTVDCLSDCLPPHSTKQHKAPSQQRLEDILAVIEEYTIIDTLPSTSTQNNEQTREVATIETCDNQIYPPIKTPFNSAQLLDVFSQLKICDSTIPHALYVKVTYNTNTRMWEQVESANGHLLLSEAHINPKNWEFLCQAIESDDSCDAGECNTRALNILLILNNEPFDTNLPLPLTTIKHIRNEHINWANIQEKWGILIGGLLGNYILQTLNITNPQKTLEATNITFTLPKILTEKQITLTEINNALIRINELFIVNYISQLLQVKVEHLLISATEIAEHINLHETPWKLEKKITACHQAIRENCDEKMQDLITTSCFIKSNSLQKDQEKLDALFADAIKYCPEGHVENSDIIHLPRAQFLWNDETNMIEKTGKWKIVLMHIHKNDIEKLDLIEKCISHSRKERNFTNIVYKFHQLQEDSPQLSFTEQILNTLEQYKTSVEIKIAVNTIEQLRKCLEARSQQKGSSIRMRYATEIDIYNKLRHREAINGLKSWLPIERKTAPQLEEEYSPPNKKIRQT